MEAMNKTTTIAIVIIIIVVAIAGSAIYWYVGQSREPSPSGTATAPAPGIPTPAATPTSTTNTPMPSSSPSTTMVTITYTDSGFSQKDITIAKGTEVVFKNSASSAFWPASNVHPVHSLYDGTTLQEHCANPTKTTFDACGPINPGSSWSFIFGKIGTWGYHNHLNPSQSGTMVVQ